jgi:hypothetical protein
VTGGAGTGAGDRLSVPIRVVQLPHEVTPARLDLLVQVADTLLPGTDVDPRPSSLPDFRDHLDTALRARGESVRELVAALDRLDVDADLMPQLRAMHGSDREAFDLVSSVVAGAYLLSPTVRGAIDYPGQGSHPAPLELAVDQLSDGILDPVVDRGPIYVSAEGE